MKNRFIIWLLSMFSHRFAVLSSRMPGWNRITIAQYNAIAAIAEEYRDKTDEKSICESNIRLLELITGRTADDLRKMSISEHSDMVKKHLSFVSEEIKLHPVKKYYKIKGKKYVLPFKNQNKINMTAYQLICYQEAIMRQPDDFANILSILLVPKGKTFSDGYDTELLRLTIQRYFSITDAVSIGFFFKILLQILSENSIRQQIMELNRKMKALRRHKLMTPEAREQASRLEEQLQKYTDNLTAIGQTWSWSRR